MTTATESSRSVVPPIEIVARVLRGDTAARMEEGLRSPRNERKSGATGGNAALVRQDTIASSVDGMSLERKSNSAPSASSRTRVYYDASLILSHGMEAPVGIVRVDYYVADFLKRDPAIDIRFVTFDAGRGGFRDLTRREAECLGRAISNRHERAVTAAGAGDSAAPVEIAPPELAHVPEPERITAREHLTGKVLLRRLRTASALPASEFDDILTRYAARLLPVTSQQGIGRRLATRVVRRIMLFGARCGHFVVFRLNFAVQHVREAGRHLSRPDPIAARTAPGPDNLRWDAEIAAANRTTASRSPPIESEPEPVPDLIRFGGGNVLLSMSNMWEYLDYAYLHRICRDDGVRFVSIIYDVIAMQFPFTTPGPAHIYHRHWVEIGHCAAHLLAISRSTAEQYREFIGQPNGLSPPLSYAHIPNLLRRRADEIHESPVVQLLDRSFVLFCATIEIRKNHQLLLQLWDRLRLEFRENELPVLVFAGKWGWGIEIVRSLAERNFRLRRHLLILEGVSDAELIWLYRRARFTLFPSLSEGYGLGAAESLSFGTPVVIANCPALVEATEGLMPAHDPLDFMAWLYEMRSLIRDNVRLEELRAAAARYEGPADDTFATAIRTIACLVSRPVAQPD